VVHGPRKNPIDFGGNSEHITLGLGLRLTFRVMLGVTVRGGPSHSRNTGYVSPSTCIIVIKGGVGPWNR